MVTAQCRTKPESLVAVDRFTRMLRDAVYAAKHDPVLDTVHLGLSGNRNWHLFDSSLDSEDTGLDSGPAQPIAESTGHNDLGGTSDEVGESALWAKLERQRKLAEINLLISKVHLLRLREFDMRTVYTLVEANLELYRGDESKVSACELSLKALTQASNFMTAVANKLPRSALTTVKDVVSASAITSALDTRLTKVLDAVKSLSRSINEGAALQRRSEGISQQISAVWKCSYWLCRPDDKVLGEKCTICLEKFVRGDVIQSPPCNHKFHSQCLRNWMKVRLSCPLCQRSWS